MKIMKTDTVSCMALCLSLILVGGVCTNTPPCDCNCPCPRIRRPVCAVNSRSTKEFANKCLWQNYNCKHKSGKEAYPELIEGPCRSK